MSENPTEPGRDQITLAAPQAGAAPLPPPAPPPAPVAEDDAPVKLPTALWVVGAFILGGAIVYAYLTWRDAYGQSAGAVAVAELLRAQQKAWNEGDLDGFLEPYWDDKELTFFSGGDMTEGLKKVKDRYERQYRSKGKEMGKLSFDDVALHKLAPDAVVARGRWTVERKGEELTGLFTLLLVRKKEGWRIVHDHTSKK